MKNYLCLFSLMILLFFAASAKAQIAAGGAFSLDKAVVAGGGATNSAGGSFSLAGTTGQNAAGTNASAQLFSQIAGFWTPNAALAPTAATVTISGRVTTADGRGIRSARVTLTDASGASRTVLTGAFGIYRFNEVSAGETYVLAVSSKRFNFENSSLVVNVQEDRNDFNFAASPVEN